MAARKTRKPGVYPCFYQIDGRPAYFVVDWYGEQSEDRRVDEFETDEEVIAYLADALWAVRPRGTGVRVQRPVLRLL